MNGKKRIKLYAAQHDFVACPDRFTAFVGGIGSGKTYAGCVKSLIESEHGGLGLVVAPTYPMLRDATLRTFMDVSDKLVADFFKGEMRAIVGNAEVLFRSADDPERLRGPNLSWAYIDEAALCHKMTWPIVIGRLREGGKAGPCWITTTPKGRNWVWQEFIQTQRPGYTMFRASTEENPYLSREYVDDLKAAYTGGFARQELYGEFIAFEGLVYEEFRHEEHTAKPPERFKEIIAGVDWGYSNPSVVLVMGIDTDGRAYVVEELYRRRLRVGDLAQEAIALTHRWNISAFICDPSEPANIDEFRRAHLNAYPANNAVTEGIQRVKARLADAGDGKRRLYISPSCVNTIAEFEGYCWKELKGGDLKDEPDKINDHAMDALRYAVMYLDGRRGVYLA